MSHTPFDLTRRSALKRLGVTLLGAALAPPALAQLHTPLEHRPGEHPHHHGAAAGPTAAPVGVAAGHPQPHPVPWHHATCAFCDMTLATPAGAPQGAGFRERTYAQWAFAEEARHFESIGCALGWAYAHGVHDGAGAALYVAAYDAADPTGSMLLAGHGVSFLWAERLPTSMAARVGAFASEADAAAFVASHQAHLGRVRFADLSLLADLAPLPIANLVPLLQRQLG
jgi:hypothetical protein